ncbi:phosphatidylinositol-3,5-bisphosphate 5-phosphatase, partial [Coemansia helicoidea]
LYANYLKRCAAGDPAPRRMGVRRQTGIVRSNCIDCLDRTNAAQSIIGKVVLAHQLFELGQIDLPDLSFNTDAAMIIEEMYHDLGNTIALQYGGSHLVNTVQTYRRSTNWRSHSRDIVESLRRYYSNSLLDMERQEAITYFLEKSIFPECNPDAARAGHPLDADDAGVVVSRPKQVGKPVFRKWWTTLGDSDSQDASSSPPPGGAAAAAAPTAGGARDSYWNEYYQPHKYTSFDELFVGSLNTSASLHPTASVQEIPSPFADRSGQDRRAASNARFAQRTAKWLVSETDEPPDPTRASRQKIYEHVRAKTAAAPLHPLPGIGGWITDGISAPLQEPSVSAAEVDEYRKCVHQFDDLAKWVVPPTTLLYSDYLRGRAEGLPPSDSDSEQYRLAVPSGLSIDTSAESVYGHAGGWPSTRAQAPAYPRQAPHSAQPARGRRLLRPRDALSPTAGRQRSSTSGERSTLWGLWTQQRQDQQQRRDRDPKQPNRTPSRFGLARAAASSLLPLSAGLPQMAQGALSRRSRSVHDRSRSLDLTDVGALPTPSALGPPGSCLGGASTGAEPRVAEADLAIYQHYVRMRKAVQ